MMASKRRVKRRECGHKRRFTSQAEVVGHLIGRERHGTLDLWRGEVHPYKCPHCGYWHYGR